MPGGVFLVMHEILDDLVPELRGLIPRQIEGIAERLTGDCRLQSEAMSERRKRVFKVHSDSTSIASSQSAD
jgi:hypothetical protein